MKRGLVWSAVPGSNKNVDGRRIDSRVFDKDVEIAVVVEDPRIDQLVFPLMLSLERLV